MKRDKILGLGLSGLSVVVAAGTGTTLLATGEGLPLAIFAWPALGFIAGMAIAFFSFVEVGLQIDDEIEQFPELVQDDMHSLRTGKITAPHLFIAVTLIAFIVEAALLIWYRKEYAFWGPINVLVVALVVVVIALFFSLRSRWFQVRLTRLSPIIFVVPAAGWLICATIGIRYAEPIEYGGLSPMERSQLIRSGGYWASTRAGTAFFLDNAEVAGSAMIDMDCDGEDCLLILLLVVVAACIFASANVPHFWVVATTLLLTLMVVIALRELLYHEQF